MAKGKKKTEFIYSVKIKVHIPGFQKKFLQGVCFAETPALAESVSITQFMNNVSPKVPELRLEHVCITNVTRLRSDFVATQFKD